MEVMLQNQHVGPEYIAPEPRKRFIRSTARLPAGFLQLSNYRWPPQ